jgi:hypothetical protein
VEVRRHFLGQGPAALPHEQKRAWLGVWAVPPQIEIHRVCHVGLEGREPGRVRFVRVLAQHVGGEIADAELSECILPPAFAHREPVVETAPEQDSSAAGRPRSAIAAAHGFVFGAAPLEADVDTAPRTVTVLGVAELGAGDAVGVRDARAERPGRWDVQRNTEQRVASVDRAGIVRVWSRPDGATLALPRKSPNASGTTCSRLKLASSRSSRQ